MLLILKAFWGYGSNHFLKRILNWLTFILPPKIFNKGRFLSLERKEPYLLGDYNIDFKLSMSWRIWDMIYGNWKGKLLSWSKHSSLFTYIVEPMTSLVYKILLGENRYLTTFSRFENYCSQFLDFNKILTQESREMFKLKKYLLMKGYRI